MESLVVVEEETVEAMAAMAAMAAMVETAVPLDPIARTRTTLALPGRWRRWRRWWKRRCRWIQLQGQGQLLRCLGGKGRMPKEFSLHDSKLPKILRVVQ